MTYNRPTNQNPSSSNPTPHNDLRGSIDSGSIPSGSDKLLDFVRQVGIFRLLFGAVMLIVAGSWVISAVSSTVNPVKSSGVGSCWANAGQQVRAVHCGDSDADYRITKMVSDPDLCPVLPGQNSVQYVIDGAMYGCLSPI